MPGNAAPPDFGQFTRWMAAKLRAPAPDPNRRAALLRAARAARDEALRAAESAAREGAHDSSPGHLIEVLQLLAAAGAGDDARPPEVITSRGFRVTLAYDDAHGAAPLPICVLVQSPPALKSHVYGRTPYLWNGAERFPLGQFDADGKAIGALPSGVHISIADFASGNVKLEEPDYPAQDHDA
jgi:hypothetical protein